MWKSSERNSDFHGGYNRTGLDICLCKERTHAMLQKSYYKIVDMVDPFLAAVEDSCCGVKSHAFMTNAILVHFDLRKSTHRLQVYPGSFKDDLQQLSRQICQLKSIGRGAFPEYRTSNMGKSK